MIEGAKAKVKAKAKAKVKAVAKPKANVKAVAKPKANVKAAAKPKVDVNNGKSASSLYKKPAKANDPSMPGKAKGETGSVHAMCVCVTSNGMCASIDII